MSVDLPKLLDAPADLKLTDFMDLAALQEIQDGFAAIANVKAIITDSAGTRLTDPNPASSFLLKRDVIATQEDEVILVVLHLRPRTAIGPEHLTKDRHARLQDGVRVTQLPRDRRQMSQHPGAAFGVQAT